MHVWAYRLRRKCVHDWQKLSLYFTNSLLLAFGITICTLGIILKIQSSVSYILKNTTLKKEAELNNFAYLIGVEGSVFVITFGAILATLSIFGIIIAHFERRRLLLVYGVLVTLLLFFLLAFGSRIIILKFLMLNEHRFEEKIKVDVVKRLKSDYNDESTNKNEFTTAIDLLQIYFACCGVNSYQDFNRTTWNKTTPVSCCKYTQQQRKLMAKGEYPTPESSECALNPSEENSNFNRGCFKPILAFIESILYYILILAIILPPIMIIGSISSFCLHCSLYD